MNNEDAKFSESSQKLKKLVDSVRGTLLKKNDFESNEADLKTRDLDFTNKCDDRWMI